MSLDARTVLKEASGGDEHAAARLLEVIYDELRTLAGRLVGPGGEFTLQPTALVHEAYLKIVGAAELDWESRTHFFAIAARAMGQVVRDHARGRGRAKRGGGWCRLTLSGVGVGPTTSATDIDVDAGRLHDALDRLRDRDDRAVTVLILRFFGGLENEQIAEVLGVSARTVRNDWNMARAWLHREMTSDAGER